MIIVTHLMNVIVIIRTHFIINMVVMILIVNIVNIAYCLSSVPKINLGITRRRERGGRAGIGISMFGGQVTVDCRPRSTGP